MKIHPHAQQRQVGSVLLVCLLTAAILGITLASYLAMTQAQNTSVMRSQTWNASIAMAEAGVEDALAMINLNSGDFELLTTWTNSTSANNWYNLGFGLYYVRRYMDSSSWGTNFYDVYILNRSNAPVIYSSGTVQWDFAYTTAPQVYFAAAGVSPPLPDSLRRLLVQTKIDPLFAVAMAAIFQIDFNGNNVATDSFDSADPNYSQNGLYPTGQPGKQKAAGDVVTDYTIVNSLSVGNANIKGQVKTGPGGTVTIGPNGTVGDKSWVEGGNLGIQPGHSANDMNVQFPNVKLPNLSWLPATPGDYTIDGRSYKYVILASGDYSINSLEHSLYVGTNVTARIKMTGNVKITGGSEEIRLATGAQVRFYMTGDSFSVAGKGIINTDGNAANFYYLGLPANTSVNFGGNASFTGAVYAPQADFALGGGGSDTYDFVGASITKSVKMNGKFNFHYDENLRRIGLGRGYLPTNWKEY